MQVSNYLKVKEIINTAKNLVVFTGAGISVESGIPPFTGSNGLWTKYDPSFIELSYFYKHPYESWKEIKHIFYDHMLNKAKPNLAHVTIAKWEQQGKVKAIITQNIDNLHQAAGSKNVLEFHGTTNTLSCIECNAKFNANSISLNSLPPKCPKCGGILKPDFVFYGEGINSKVYQDSLNYILQADVILIIGTAGEVYPACNLPRIAKQHNPKITIVEINPSKSSFTNDIVDYYFDISAVGFFKKMI